MALTDYVIMPSADYTAACDKVRERTGKTDPIKSGDLAAEIEAIPSGGGEADPLEGVFEGTTTEVVLPTATKLRDYAFYSAPITKITMPKVTEIGKYAFYDCSQLPAIDIPNTLSTLPIRIFMECTLLSQVVLPTGLTNIDEGAFYGCTNLALTSLPEGVKMLGNNAFRECTNLALTSLPEGLTTLAQYAFFKCTNLALTSLPEGVTSIPNNCFAYCTNLPLASLPDGLTEIGEYAFQYCTNLALTFIPNSVKTIKMDGLHSTNLANISLPAGITTNTYALGSNNSLARVTFRGKPKSLSTSTFYNCPNLSTIYVPWSQGEVSGAPWGATKATIIYDYTGEIKFTINSAEFSGFAPITWREWVLDDSYYKEGNTFAILNDTVLVNGQVIELNGAAVNPNDLIISEGRYEILANYTVTYNAPNCAFDPMPTTITEGGTFEARAFADAGYNFNTFQVYMGSFDVTETAVSNYGKEAQIRIEDVTGDVVITITTTDALVYGVTVNLDSHLTHINYADSIASDNAEGYKDTYYLESGYVIDTVDVTIGGVEHNEYFHVTTNGGYTEIPMDALTGDIVITLTTKGA